MNKYRQYRDEDALFTAEYAQHVQAMTAEQLHSKSEIAVDLAGRDREVAALRQERDALKLQNQNLIEIFNARPAITFDEIRRIFAPELAEHDAEVVDQFKGELVKSVNSLLKPHIEGVCAVVKNRIRRKAQESNDANS